VTDVGYVSALVLALVMAWAGVAKLRSRSETAASFAAFGVPAGLARVVPLVELALAVALVFVPALAAGAAAVLLAAFTVVLVRAIGRGVTVGCNCFGSSRSEPVSSVELVRNTMLIALAIVATGAAVGVPSFESVVLVSTAVALGAVVLAALDMRRRIGSVWDNTLAGEARR
jgi:hypothetical protein